MVAPAWVFLRYLYWVAVWFRHCEYLTSSLTSFYQDGRRRKFLISVDTIYGLDVFFGILVGAVLRVQVGRGRRQIFQSSSCSGLADGAAFPDNFSRLRMQSWSCPAQLLKYLKIKFSNAGNRISTERVVSGTVSGAGGNSNWVVTASPRRC